MHNVMFMMLDVTIFLPEIDFIFLMGGLFGPLSPLGIAALVKGDSGFGSPFCRS